MALVPPLASWLSSTTGTILMIRSRLAATFETLSLGDSVIQPWHWKSLDLSESVTGNWIIGGFRELSHVSSSLPWPQLISLSTIWSISVSKVGWNGK